MGEVLTQMPSIGDKVKYIGDLESYLISGKVYTIAGVDQSDGEAYFYDEEDDREYIKYHSFASYTLENEVENPGEIVICECEPFDEGLYNLTVEVDEKGRATIEALANDSDKFGKQKAIKDEIARLQAELKKL